MAGLLDWLSKSVKEVMDMGYPESVAKRIVSGELPMDEASRMARATEQGFDPKTYYHGGSPDIRDLNTLDHADMKTRGTGTWFSDSPEVANSYLPEDGMLYPVKIKTGLMDKVDAKGSTWSSIDGPRITRDGNVMGWDQDEYNRVFSNDPSYSHPFFSQGDVETTDELARLSGQAGGKGLIIEDVVDIGPNFKMPRETKDDWLGWLLDYEQKGGRNIAVQDPSTVRSVNAAFDPEYTGPNILGSRIAPTAGAGILGALALGDSEDAMAMDSALPMAVQAAGQSAMDAKPDYGRDFGTVAGLLDMLLPLVGETLKPQMMGDAELTEEQRKRGYYRGL
jgi:hypothetical protein